MMKIAIDVGGTFTDCLVLDGTGEIREFKSPTTPNNPTIGLTRVLEKAASDFRQDLPLFLSKVGVMIAHGTTLSTNALLTGKVAKVGLLATEGFRDTLEMRRGYKNIRTSRFNLFVPPYRPLVPRYLRLGVRERIRDTGEILTPLHEADVHAAIAQFKEEKVEAVAVCFLHSYINPTHEERAAQICRKELNGVYVTASHEVLPVYREYERFSTAVVSAAVGPITEKYLSSLTKQMQELGFRGTLYLVRGGGLVQSVEESIRCAVSLIGSGPAAAPAGAIRLGQCVDTQNLFSVDMGGTSFDVSLIRDGVIPSTDFNWIGDERVAIKMVDVPSVGAGGGSIASINSLGLLQVGPQSAGADPGPACYGKGGSQATVTDADLILGYVPADYFLGGEIPLRTDLAEQAKLPVPITPPKKITTARPEKKSVANRRPQTGKTAVAAVPLITDDTPLLQQMPQDFQRALPSLAVTIHVYSHDETQRILFINNREYRKGSQIEGGIGVEDIVPDGVVLSYRGERFKLSRPR